MIKMSHIHKVSNPERIIKLTGLVLLFITYSLFFSLTATAKGKREFRGAWIQCVNGQFQEMGTENMKQTLTYQLDVLKRYGANAIIFQVRPECDALYESKYEPWSRFLTGKQGMPPQPYWDPLQWMVEECHKRGMELHAWINPFRAKTKVTKELARTHIAMRRPDLVFPYDGLYILDPAKEENRVYICQIAADIIRRYDVDGLHIDDYFYPYPASGCVIPDEIEFRNDSKGFTDIGDWRRDNVNTFIRQLHDTIRNVKPWVKFGVSPFGIYRNKANDPQRGSATNGLQNYDQLYADVILWVNNGWIDYCVPQLYWEIGHKAADYNTLIQWWNYYAANRPLFIGEDVERTVKYADAYYPQQHQMAAKYYQHEILPNVNGTVLWYAKAAVDNIGNYGTMLQSTYWNTPALQPSMSFIDNTLPGKISKMKPVWTNDGYILFWKEPQHTSWKDKAVKYVVYQFDVKEPINIEDPTHIVGITENPWFKLPYENGKTRYMYVVTALNRLSNEGEYVKKKIKL